MRTLEILVWAAFIGLIGLAVWAGRQWFPNPLLQAPIVEASPAKHELSKEAKLSRSGTTTASARRSVASGTSAPVEAASLPAQLPPGKTAVTKATLAVPDSDTLALGTTRSELRKRYATPTAAVAWVRDGRLVERLYYLKPDHLNMVVATLQNGRLISAQTVERWLAEQSYQAESPEE